MAPRIQSLFSNGLLFSAACLLVGSLAACSTPKPPPELASAQMAYDTAAADADIAKFASVPLYEAKKELERANRTWSDGHDADQTAHVARLAERRVEIARANAEGGRARSEVEALLESRRQVELEAREKEIADLKELQAKPTDSGMVLTLGGDVLFKTGSSTVSPGAQAQLGRIAQFLSENATREVVVSGHTDSVGGADVNQRLSERRAAAVGAYFSAQGIAASRIATRGFGASLPIAPNDTAAGRQQNRRVDIVILNEGQKAAEHVLARP